MDVKLFDVPKGTRIERDLDGKIVFLPPNEPAFTLERRWTEGRGFVAWKVYDGRPLYSEPVIQ